MNLRWITWLLLFALLVMVVSSKKSKSKSASWSRSGRSSHSGSHHSGSKKKSHSGSKKKSHSHSGSKKKSHSHSGSKKKSHSHSGSKKKSGSSQDDSGLSKFQSGSRSHSHHSGSRSPHSHGSRGHGSRSHSHSHRHGSRRHGSRGSHSHSRSRSGSRSGDWRNGNRDDIWRDWTKDRHGKRDKARRGNWRSPEERRKSNDYGCACKASGDPHFTTCDGKTFDYQGQCSYTLVTNDCPGAFHDANALIFRVVISTEQWKTSDRTVTKEVNIILKKGEQQIRLTLDSTNGKIKENGIWADLPSLKADFYETTCSSRDMVVDVFESLRVTWDFSMKVSVSLHDKYINKVCGLCGNYDGNDANDFLSFGAQTPLAAGSSEEELVPFGDSWLHVFDGSEADAKCKEPIVAVNPCDQKEIRDKVEALCGIINSATVFPGASDRLRKFYYHNCMTDYCMDDTDKSEACLHIRDFASECANAGTTVDDKAIDAVCAYDCPAGKEFKRNYLGDRLCTGPEDEPLGPASTGCFCKDGMFLDGTDCVTIDACGCSLDGVYMKVNAEKVTDQCTVYRRCLEDGTMVVRDFQCHADATCETENGKQVCRCKAGFKGDGLTKCEKIELNTISVRHDGEYDRTSFKASSIEPPFNSYDGRLNGESCWKPLSSDNEPWLQVALLEEFTIKGIRFQACPDGSCSISDVMVSYRLEETCEDEECGKFITAQEFTSVSLAGEHTDVMLEKAIPKARFVRVHVKNNAGCVGLRMEIIGERSNCPVGYHPKLNSCYMHVSSPKSYADARIHCAKTGGYIAEVFDRIENDYVNFLKNKVNGNDIMLGITVSELDGLRSWYNEHGSSNKFLGFKDGAQTDKNCARMLFGGEWAANDCNWSLQFVCESGGGNSCPEPWTRYNDGCYFLVEEKLTFADAVARCEAMDGHVPFITSPRENIAISSISDGEQTWIGLNDVHDEGKFRHYLLDRPLSFDGWASGEPNDWGDGEDCATTNWRSRGAWNDVSCDREYTTVCERGLNKHHIDLGVCDDNPCNSGGNCIGFYNWNLEKAEYKCKCHNGRSGDTCGEARCDCFAWGDPHFGTCDGKEFLYQGLCSYTMAQDGCGDSPKTFQIVIKTADFPKYPGTSRTLYVDVLTDFIGGLPMNRLSLQGGHKNYHNGQLRENSFTLRNGVEVKRTNGKTYVDLKNGVTVIWDGNMRVHLDIDHTHMGEICGMCGNFDGDRNNDIRDANGDGKIDTFDYNHFGDSYQFNPDCNEVPEDPLPVDELCNNASPETQALVAELIDELASENFKECILHLGDEAVEKTINNIKMETCSTGLRRSGCNALMSLQLQCSRADMFFCLSASLQCGEATGENEIYYCGEGAEVYCGDTEGTIIDRWVPDYLGLKCAEGFVRDGGKCILPEECGCHIECANGEKFILAQNTMRLGPMCTVEYSCRYDNVLKRYITGEEPRPCNVNADCFEGQCVCRSCYEGDGYQCEYVTDPTVDDLEGYILGVTCNSRLSDSSIRLNPRQEREDGRSGRPGRLCKEDIFFMPPPDATTPYIEITLDRETPIRAIITRGYLDLDCWPEAVEIHISRDNGDTYHCLKDDEDSCLQYATSYQLRKIAVKEFRAKFIRIVPIKSIFRQICLQVELFGGKVYDCPKRFTSLRSGCYALIDREVTFEKAVTECSLMNGYVTEISSMRELNAIKEFADGRDIWLGLSDLRGNSRFENLRGSPSLFSNFAPFEPTPMEPNWANIFMRGDNGKWVRWDGAQMRYVVCEVGGDALTVVPEGRRLGAEFRGEIPDSQFSSTSFRDRLFPESGRLNFFGENSGWAPNPSDEDPYLQIQFNSPNQVTGMIIQGRGDSLEFTERFRVSYSLNCNDFDDVMDGDEVQVFHGPADCDSPVVIIFATYFNALCVRVYPVMVGQEVPIALRVEFYGILIEPVNPCMGGLLANLELAPDNGFSSSHCAVPENEAAAEVEFDLCAPKARWNENSIFWSPGVRGKYEFIQIQFVENIVARAFRVKVKAGTEMPAFHVHYSPDGIKWLCGLYGEPESPQSLFPASGEADHVYKLAFELDLRFIRILPKCDNIPYLMIDIMGCTKKEAAEIDREAPVLVEEPVLIDLPVIIDDQAFDKEAVDNGGENIIA